MDAKKDAYGNELTTRLSFAFSRPPGGKFAGKWCTGGRPNVSTGEPTRDQKTGTVLFRKTDESRCEVAIFVRHRGINELADLRNEFASLCEIARKEVEKNIEGAVTVVRE